MMALLTRGLCLISLSACSLFCLSSQAYASPWTLPKDELALGIGYDFQFATSEYLNDGLRQDYPLNGEFNSSTLIIDGRYGFTDRFEGAMRLTAKQVSYISDPVLLALPEDPEDIGATRAEIKDFSQSKVGLADVFFVGRYNLHRSWWLATLELSTKVPTIYSKPNGINVTLGDRQVDLQPSILLGGFSEATLTFARLDAGYKVRFGGPGHQLNAGARLGQLLGSRFTIFGGVDLTQTLFRGESFGQNFVIRDPAVTAQEIQPSDVINAPLSLDRDLRRGELGLIVRLPQVELQLGYSYIFSGANIGALHSVHLTTVIALPDITN